MNNVTLIGMPGVGKSTLGVVLAKILGYQFLDSDLLIQKQEKRKLSCIIEEDGIEGFKKIENRVNASIEVQDTVIATGGSVVYCDEAMHHLKSVGKVVYLKLSYRHQKTPWKLKRQRCCAGGRTDASTSYMRREFRYMRSMRMLW